MDLHGRQHHMKLQAPSGMNVMSKFVITWNISYLWAPDKLDTLYKVIPISGFKIGVLCLIERGHRYEFCLVISPLEKNYLCSCKIEFTSAILNCILD